MVLQEASNSYIQFLAAHRPKYKIVGDLRRGQQLRTGALGQDRERENSNRTLAQPAKERNRILSFRHDVRHNQLRAATQHHFRTKALPRLLFVTELQIQHTSTA